jgi:hypothetical protein
MGLPPKGTPPFASDHSTVASDCIFRLIEGQGFQSNVDGDSGESLTRFRPDRGHFSE